VVLAFNLLGDSVRDALDPRAGRGWPSRAELRTVSRRPISFPAWAGRYQCLGDPVALATDRDDYPVQTNEGV